MVYIRQYEACPSDKLVPSNSHLKPIERKSLGLDTIHSCPLKDLICYNYEHVLMFIPKPEPMTKRDAETEMLELLNESGDQMQ